MGTPGGPGGLAQSSQVQAQTFIEFSYVVLKTHKPLVFGSIDISTLASTSCTKLSVMMKEVFYICTVQYSSH